MLTSLDRNGGPAARSALLYDRLVREAGGLGASHRWLLERVTPGARVLDCGCAGGYLAHALVEERGCIVDGVEYDPEAAQAAEAACRRVFVGSLEDEGFVAGLTGPYDFVLFGDVLEHLRDPESTLRWIAPVLAPEGRVLLSLPNVAYWRVRWELLRGRFEYGEHGILDRTHLRFFTVASAHALAEAAGYRVRAFEVTSPLLPRRRGRTAMAHLIRRLPNLLGYQVLLELEPRAA